MRKPATTFELWGRQCGSGWDALVQPLEDEVSRLGGRIRQVKQKFGQLCFFYSLPSSVSESERRAFALRVKEAEQKSARVCETCGNAGHLSKDGGLHLTRCESCFRKSVSGHMDYPSGD